MNSTGGICVTGVLLVVVLNLVLPALVAAEPVESVTGDMVRELAVERHPSVVAALNGLEKAEAGRRMAGSWPDPDLEGRLLWDSDSETEIEAALRFAIPWSGRLAAARKAADLSMELARLDVATARLSAAVEADRLLARLAWSRARVDLHRSLSERSSEQAGLARRRRDANLADPLEVSLILADAARDRRSLIECLNNESAITAELLLLTGLTPETAIETAPLVWVARTRDRVFFLEQARENGPHLAAARLRMARAEEAARAAGRSRLPDLSLGPALTRNTDNTSWGVSVGIPLPLFPTTRAAYQEALVDQRGAEESFDLESRTMPVKVDLLLDRLTAFEGQLEELGGVTAEAAEEAFRMAQARWTAGKLEVLHLLSAHRAFADIRIERLNILLQLWETWLDLSLAVGLPPDGMNDQTVMETGQ